MIVLTTIGFVAVVAYWLVWYVGDRAWLASLDTPSYYTFENSFPAADGWLAIGFAASAWTLKTRRPSAMFWLLVCGSASLYLGLMDILFDVENGVYRAPDTGAVITEGVINVSSVAIGVWAMWFGWHHRRWLLAATAPTSG